MKYDFLIVGAGLFGAVFAYEAKQKGKLCLVIDKRPHIAGNTYTENIEGIEVHKYGAHIFHTSNKKIWDFANKFVEFNHYVNSPVARFEDKLYNLPFNMNTFYQLWGVTTPADAIAKIKSEVGNFNPSRAEPSNLEEQALSLVGKDIYEKLIKGYTEKQWGRKCSELPASIIKRLPLRFTFDNNYFNDKYQGIPIGGYTNMVKNILHDAEVLVNTDYFKFIKENQGIAKKIIYTGSIDEYYNYCYGTLEYRSLHFENEILDNNNFQGNAVVNYTDIKTPFTRIIEHKHFEFGNQEKTVITREYPAAWNKGLTPYYPINDKKNNTLYQQYKKLAEKECDVFFGGRLGQYAYYDMDDVIEASINMAHELLV